MLANLTALVTIPLYGALSDRVGRKPVFMTGIIGAAAYLYFILRFAANALPGADRSRNRAGGRIDPRLHVRLAKLFQANAGEGFVSMTNPHQRGQAATMCALLQAISE